ncbi:acyltransferase, partial [Salmonella enterica subsp. enterica serovar Berta]|nr:acyltransferase [Salmonella enterica subsp. enterica serovar Berta]
MKKNNKIQNIEALRGSAIVLVLIAHSFFFPPLFELLHFFDFGRGVDVFFLISGFLMGSTYLSKIDLYHFDLLKAYNFYARRFLRLFPAMLFWSAIILIMSKYWINIGIFQYISDVFRFVSSNLVFMGNFFNNNHQNALGYWWSLGLEGQFYLALPIIIYLSGPYFWKVVVSICLILSLSAIWTFDYFWMFRIHGLFIGLVMWRISQENVFLLIKDKIGSLSSLHFNIIALFLIFSGILIPTSITSAQPFVSLVVSIIFGMVLLLALCNENKLFGALNFVFVFFGKISYSLYLSHLLVFHIGLYIINRYGLVWMENHKVSLLFISIAVAYLSYKF